MLYVLYSIREKRLIKESIVKIIEVLGPSIVRNDMKLGDIFQIVEYESGVSVRGMENEVINLVIDLLELQYDKVIE